MGNHFVEPQVKVPVVNFPTQCSAQAEHVFPPPLTLFPWCASANMARLVRLLQYGCKFHDLKGGATDASQPRGPKSFDILPAL